MARFKKIRSIDEVISQLSADSSRTPDVTISEEAKFLDDEIKREQLKRLREDNQARKSFSREIFTITVVWMFVVLMVVICCGNGNLHLSDPVLITLITTTTANVFGFFYVVVNYLFNKERST